MPDPDCEECSGQRTEWRISGCSHCGALILIEDVRIGQLDKDQRTQLIAELLHCTEVFLTTETRAPELREDMVLRFSQLELD